MKRPQVPGPGFSGHDRAQQYMLDFDGRHGHPPNTEHMFHGRQRDEDGVVNLVGMRGREVIVISQYHQFGGNRCTCGHFIVEGFCCGCHKDYLYH